MKPNFKQLMQEAKVAQPTVGQRPERQALARRNERDRLQKIKGDIRGAEIAREFVRNGGNLHQAYQSVTKFKAHGKTAKELLGAGAERFFKDMEEALARVGIDKDQMLQLLWAQTHMSPLDFMDDEGHTLTIPELKKLPAHIRAAINEVRQEITPVPLIDPNTKQPILDDNGNPYYVNRRLTRVKILDREQARSSLLSMMRWVGPSTVIDNRTTINYAKVVREADTRSTRVARTFEMAKDLELEVKGEGM